MDSKTEEFRSATQQRKSNQDIITIMTKVTAANTPMRVDDQNIVPMVRLKSPFESQDDTNSKVYLLDGATTQLENKTPFKKSSKDLFREQTLLLRSM